MHQHSEEAIIKTTSNDPFLSSQNMTCTVVARVKDKYQLYLKMIKLVAEQLKII